MKSNKIYAFSALFLLIGIVFIFLGKDYVIQKYQKVNNERKKISTIEVESIPATPHPDMINPNVVIEKPQVPTQDTQMTENELANQFNAFLDTVFNCGYRNIIANPTAWDNEIENLMFADGYFSYINNEGDVIEITVADYFRVFSEYLVNNEVELSTKFIVDANSLTTEVLNKRITGKLITTIHHMNDVSEAAPLSSVFGIKNIELGKSQTVEISVEFCSSGINEYKITGWQLIN